MAGPPRVSKYLKLCHARSIHHSCRRNTPLSVACLLDSPPADPENVTINGFIRSIRNQKTLSFASIGDGSSLAPLQALLTPAQAQSLSTGTAVRLSGSWKPSPNPKGQSHELHVTGVDILGPADSAYNFPLQKKYHTPEFLRTIPHIRSRTPLNAALLRFRSHSIAQLTKFFADRDFTQTHPPIITSSDCEGAGEVFSIDTADKGIVTDESDGTFFRSTKYLTVSSQLHLEALAQSVGKVWTLSPTFRAEKSETSRHLSEFYMLEAEANFVDNMEDIMKLVEDMLRHLTTSLYKTSIGQELLHGKRAGDEGDEGHQRSKTLEGHWQGMMRESWPRITYTEAIKSLQGNSQEFHHKAQWGHGLQAEHERYIADTVGKGSPVFVTNYPRSIKPFYMSSSPTTTAFGETADCFDLLVPEVCELVGGSMREYRFESLLSNMQENGLIPSGLDPSDDSIGSLKWYLDLRRWGSVPHGGFGLGFDRLLGYLAGIHNIKDVVTFPRWVGRCDC